MTPQEMVIIEQTIRAVEWTGAPDGRNVCPWCGNFQHEGHAEDCPRQATLGILADAIRNRNT